MRLKGGELLLDLTKLGDIAELDEDESTDVYFPIKDLEVYIQNGKLIIPKRININVIYNKNVTMFTCDRLFENASMDTTSYNFYYLDKTYRLDILFDELPVNITIVRKE